MTTPHEIRYSYLPVPTLEKFANSDAFIRGVMGPFGSGKSSACVIEIVNRAMNQRPGPDGVRRTRWAVIRNTYTELRDTTIRTVMEWLPEHYFGRYVKHEHSYKVTAFENVEFEILFLALDRPEDIKKLLSLELTGAWVNEAREVAWAVIEALQARVGRFPSARSGGCTWSGIWMDTNPPDSDSKWYHFFEEKAWRKDFDHLKSEGILPTYMKADDYVAFFKQPSGLVPHAENLANLPGGKMYYARLIAGKAPEWVKIYVHGDYGFLVEGKLIYPTYVDAAHCKAVEPQPGLPVLRSWDFGLTPACVFHQELPDGRWLVFDEMTADNLSVDKFSDDVLEHCNRAFRGQVEFDDIGDPAGENRAETDARSAFDILQAKGIEIRAAKSQVPDLRQGSVDKALRTPGPNFEPMFVLHPRCKMLRKGFLGGYHRRRLRTSGPERYSDKAEKNEYSHCFPAGTMVSTPQGPRPIEELKVGDRVVTPLGARKVQATMSRMADSLVDIATRNGHHVTCTPNHPIWMNGSFVRADALQYGDVLWSHPEWADQPSMRRKISTAGATIASRLATTKRPTEGTCTGMCGSSTTDRYRTAITSTIWTMIAAITRLKIWTACPALSTSPCTCASTSWRTPTKSPRIWNPCASWRQSGTNPRKAARSIAKTPSRWMRACQSWITSAFTAGAPIVLSRASASVVIAPTLASQLRAEHAVTMTSNAPAPFALRRSGSIGTPTPSRVDLLAAVSSSLRGASRVYDLTVADAHCFYANGILVSNCHDALQYGVEERFLPILLNEGQGEYDDWPEPSELGPSGRSDFTGY